MAVVRHKEAIHSGHFMVSNFEAEEQDDEENVAVPVPEEGSNADISPEIVTEEIVNNHFEPLVSFLNSSNIYSNNLIDVSLNKLFQCMSIAYRQKLTSPKWNRFRGMKLRWKDKIRLNNVIWRCWHMQFIKGHRKLVCAFANPLEIDNHNKTEAGAILEGKYWKRKLATVTAEYKRWRIFYKQQHETLLTMQPFFSDHFMDATNNLYQYGTKDDVDLQKMITDADFFVDALFNSLGSHRDFPRHKDPTVTNNADVIQPEMAHFHTNLDELMDLDPIAPLQDFLSTKLPEVENVNFGWRGKSLTPDQDVFNLPLPDIKDIDVFEMIDSRYRTNSVSEVLGVKSSTKAPKTIVQSTTVSSAQNRSSQDDSQIQVKPSEVTSCETRRPIARRGKLWSAAVKQAQEMELQQAKQELVLQGSVNPLSKPKELEALPQNSMPVHPHPIEVQQGASQPVYLISQDSPQNLNREASLHHQQLHHTQLKTLQDQQLRHPQLKTLQDQQLQHPQLKTVVQDLPQPSHQSVIRGNSGNKVGVIEHGFRASEYIRRPDPVDDYPRGLNLKIPRLDVFSNNPFALQSNLEARNSDKSRRVSAPGGMSVQQPVQVQQTATLHIQQMVEPQPAQEQQPKHLLGPTIRHTTGLPAHQPDPLDQQKFGVNQRIVVLSPMPPKEETPFLKREDSQLVQLLQENSRVRSNNIKPEPDDTSHYKYRKRSKLVPPPPPGSLPQPPAFTAGSSSPNPGIADETKMSMAEQKRRCTIKNGFDFLKTLVPSLAQNPNIKISKAALLLKGAEYVEQLKSEREDLSKEISEMRASAQQLTADIVNFQAQLPSQGSSASKVQTNRPSELENMFEAHVSACTMQNWKYWVFSQLMHPLLESFDKTVSSNSFEDMTRSSSSWLDQHASLVHLRPLMMEALKELSVKTDILHEPQRMPHEALKSISLLRQTEPDKSRSNQEESSYTP